MDPIQRLWEFNLFAICKLLVLRYLENEHVREPQWDALRWA